VDVVGGAAVVLLVDVVGAVVDELVVVLGTVLDVVVEDTPVLDVVVEPGTVVVVLVDVVVGSRVVVVVASTVVVVLPIVDELVLEELVEEEIVVLVDVVLVAGQAKVTRRPVTMRSAQTTPVRVLARPSWNRASGAEMSAWTCTPAPSFTAVPPTCRIGVGIVPFGPSVLPFSRRTSPVTSMVVWPAPRTWMAACRPTRSEQNW
jgi:hypothetical protein